MKNDEDNRKSNLKRLIQASKMVDKRNFSNLCSINNSRTNSKEKERGSSVIDTINMNNKMIKSKSNFKHH